MRLLAALCVLALVLVEIKADGEMLRAISGTVHDKKFNYRQKSGNRHNHEVLSGSRVAIKTRTTTTMLISTHQTPLLTNRKRQRRNGIRHKSCKDTRTNISTTSKNGR